MNKEQTPADRLAQQEMLDAAIRDNMKRIKHKLIVMSGKGGVGKSTVSTNLAYGLMMSGFKVGLMDTDIHGPSLGKMLGIEGKFVQPADQGGLLPIEVNGIKVITMASIMQDSDAPVIWRGPLKMGAIKQFLGDIHWGDLDYLVIDSPPGTGDEPLSVCQLIPEADGSLIVTTPQDVALIDSRKTVRFSQALKIPILGIIENMSGFNCPHCNKPIDLFKVGGGEKAAKTLNVPFLGRIPIDPQIVETSDSGEAYIYSYAKTEAGKAMQEIVDRIVKKTKKD
ncbi:P-loop NTPase [candidate division KSB1 bacterium]|nr:P-loop NTPase [candidate division KSB1 bacterium]